MCQKEGRNTIKLAGEELELVEKKFGDQIHYENITLENLKGMREKIGQLETDLKNSDDGKVREKLGEDLNQALREYKI